MAKKFSEITAPMTDSQNNETPKSALRVLQPVKDGITTEDNKPIQM